MWMDDVVTDFSGSLSPYTSMRQILALARKLFERLIYSRQVQIVFAKDLETGKLRFGSPDRFNIRLLSYPEDYPLLREAHRGRARRFRGWAEQGAIVLGGFKDGKLVAIHVLACGTFKEPFCRNQFDLAPGEWLMIGGWVARDFRGSRIAGAMFARTLALIEERDGKRAIATVYDDNLAPLKFLLHSGFEETGEMLIVRHLLGFCWASRVRYTGSRVEHVKRRSKG